MEIKKKKKVIKKRIIFSLASSISFYEFNSRKTTEEEKNSKEKRKLYAIQLASRCVYALQLCLELLICHPCTYTFFFDLSSCSVLLFPRFSIRFLSIFSLSLLFLLFVWLLAAKCSKTHMLTGATHCTGCTQHTTLI